MRELREIKIARRQSIVGRMNRLFMCLSVIVATGSLCPAQAAEKGLAFDEHAATPVELIKTAEGFKTELLYSVPGAQHGSWVALASDPNGSIYASDQYGSLYQFNPPAPGETLTPSDIKKVPVDIRAINGMIYVDGALYAGVNDYERKIQSGFYRISDSDGDSILDKVELLRAFNSRGDHGVHAVVPTADGKYFYLITGNNAVISEGGKEGTSNSSQVAKVWGDDHLLPRMPDGRGHNRHVLAPGGIVYRVSRDGKEFEIYASGFRNIYGGGLNKDGELFTYDADMEYDFNTPWYRPTRVNHVLSGAEYGWRNGAGKYPEFYPDTVPATLNIGPGSPTGTRFGYGAKFPAKYQNAFYILDWSWGKIYAVHLEEDGASYTGTKEEFVTSAPLPVTDLIVHPNDGAMYFAIGGRKVQSGLYRVTYEGNESTAPVDMTPKVTPLRKLRHSLEEFHGKVHPKAVEAAWPHLNHKDRSIRNAARVVLEHQPTRKWAKKGLNDTVPGRRIPALLALARVKGVAPSHRPESGHVVNTRMRGRILDSLLELDFKALSQEDQIGYVRLLEIVFVRFGKPSQDKVDAVIAKLDPSFPASTFELNWLLCETLAYLQAPNTAAKGMALIASAESQEPQMQYARSLRFLKTGWTPELRKQQLEWFLKAANYRGGASFTKFIEFIRNDSLATFTDAEMKLHADLIAKEPESMSVIENLGAMFAGRSMTDWKMDDLSDATRTQMKGRDFENGKKMFSASACLACHRFGNAGGMTGPDLTGARGQYSAHDLLDQIINPSKVISDQFAPIVVTLDDGDTISGVVVNLNGNNVTLNTDLTNPNQRVNVARNKVESIEISEVSPMPPGLLSMLTKEEILDLLAYVLSGGDASNAMFQ
jgi:putative heme-binding domain-containing protein